MNRKDWYTLFRDVRTPCIGPNLFRLLDGQTPAEVALEIARFERKERWRERQAKLWHKDAA
jgi:hypothetical protein